MSTQLDGTTAHDWISEFARTFTLAQQQLTELDRLAGDGDFGTNIASALRRADEALPTVEDATFRSVFAAVSKGFLATGGTSGPLFGMWFRHISRSANATATLSELAAGVAAGLDAIQKLGGAKVGDNTMIDALAPASTSLVEDADRGLALPEALERAAHAARAGALSTGELVANRGRASYVGELARGVLDPGAVTIALFFEAGATASGSTQHWETLDADALTH
ncbi:dihydroxyacetone kinase subunit DhaL [Leifsonia shinshuensis]|uniref:Dihydroxyacetone kinase subunit L n=1 Tax=Leifsonia shinshuensis TaxID=150026 RepID=A0A7G6YE10_9MICO|nr:dihydroxyacetone kinase subunit DhaL [Leifsonia shinshuensis]QNE36725.1 dihydroxyacetone kinase subunit L [Leifsonia shinshuensis]